MAPLADRVRGHDNRERELTRGDGRWPQGARCTPGQQGYGLTQGVNVDKLQLYRPAVRCQSERERDTGREREGEREIRGDIEGQRGRRWWKWDMKVCLEMSVKTKQD